MPRIFYYMYSGVISGGEMDSYHHVDILNSCGYDAYALHFTGAPHTWFKNQTKVIDGPSFWEIYNPERDYLVLPEPLGESISSMPGKKVIFNKNLYMGFNAMGLKPGAVRYPYTESKVVAVFTVSKHNYECLEFAFPEAKLFRMYTRIDCDMFAYKALPNKKRRIAIVDKSEEPLSVLYNMLRARAQAGLNNLLDYDLTFLRHYTHSQIAEILSDSFVLITVSTYEGLPRIVLEAMASGCIIISYGSGTLKESLIPEYQFEPDDFLAMARCIEDIARAFPDNIDSWEPGTIRARKIAEEFSLEKQQKHVIEAWEQILLDS
jgi:Glycosyl transferases group 1